MGECAHDVRQRRSERYMFYPREMPIEPDREFGLPFFLARAATASTRETEV